MYRDLAGTWREGWHLTIKLSTGKFFKAAAFLVGPDCVHLTLRFFGSTHFSQEERGFSSMQIIWLLVATELK